MSAGVTLSQEAAHLEGGRIAGCAAAAGGGSAGRRGRSCGTEAAACRATAHSWSGRAAAEAGARRSAETGNKEPTFYVLELFLWKISRGAEKTLVPSEAWIFLTIRSSFAVNPRPMQCIKLRGVPPALPPLRDSPCPGAAPAARSAASSAAVCAAGRRTSRRPPRAPAAAATCATEAATSTGLKRSGESVNTEDINRSQ